MPCLSKHILLCFIMQVIIYFSPVLHLQIRNHRVHLILEDPVLQLSTIKDDDHLAVYRLPKLEKRASYVQFVHRREDL
jgi:ubiquitin carboxyl-terminal hydrolase 4/11/15